MTEKELKETLQKHLKLECSSITNFEVKITLKYDKEVITEDTFYKEYRHFH